MPLPWHPGLLGGLVPRARARPARSLSSGELGQRDTSRRGQAGQNDSGGLVFLRGSAAPSSGVAELLSWGPPRLLGPLLPAPRAGCTCVVGDVLEDVLVGHELHLQRAAAAASPLRPAHGGVRHVGAAPPPGGAAAGGARTGPASPLTAPLLRDRGPLPAPPAEAAAAGGGTGLTCQPVAPRGSQPGRRALSDLCHGQPAPRCQPASAAGRDFRRPARARSRGSCPRSPWRREAAASPAPEARPRRIPLRARAPRGELPSAARITLLKTSNSQSIHFCSETARYLFNIFIYLYIYIYNSFCIADCVEFYTSLFTMI